MIVRSKRSPRHASRGLDAGSLMQLLLPASAPGMQICFITARACNHFCRLAAM